MLELKSYDPNQHWGTHVVEVTLQTLDYVGSFRYEVRGNVKGLSVIQNPAEYWFDDHEEGEEIILTRADGGTLACEIFEESDLEEMITGVRIVEFRPEADEPKRG